MQDLNAVIKVYYNYIRIICVNVVRCTKSVNPKFHFQRSEKMEGFSFVTLVTGLNRPNTGNEDDDDDDNFIFMPCILQ
jgi:hypothetical protein